MMTQKRPQSSDYASNFASYILQVPDGDFLETLEAQRQKMTRLLAPLTDKSALICFAPSGRCASTPTATRRPATP